MIRAVIIAYALAVVGLILNGCAPGAGLLDPALQYDHPFAGRMIVHDYDYRGGPLLSWATNNYVLDGYLGREPRCDVTLPRVGGPGIDETLRAKLRRIEQANCNGGWRADVNARREPLPMVIR